MDYILVIKRLMKVKGITQREFAKKLNLTTTTVNNYLTKKTKIDVDTLIKIADVLGVSACLLFQDLGDINDEDDTKKLLNILSIITFLHDRTAKEMLKYEEVTPIGNTFVNPSIDIYNILYEEQMQLLLKKNYISNDLITVLNRQKKAPKNIK